MFGNMGIVLELDLATGESTEIKLDEEVYRHFIGGAGLAAKLLYDRGQLSAGPLDPEALLIFTVGPLAGTSFSGTSRSNVSARSPLTGIWGQSNCGGNWGPGLKSCGYDGIILKGRATSPSYLLLGDRSIEVRDAGHLWGKDTYEATDALKAIHGKKAKVLTIGPAAENGVLYGAIANDKANYFGRAGMGTVLASKNIKALVAQGTQKPLYKDPDRVKELARLCNAENKESIWNRGIGGCGTAANWEAKMYDGDGAIKNWSQGFFEEGAQLLSGAYWWDTPMLTRKHACLGCNVGCKPVVKIDEGPYAMAEGAGPELETLGGFGSMLLNANVEAVAKANDICNRLGMDTITCGSTIAWAMECFEKGILEPEECDGIELRWGETVPVMKLLANIASRSGKLGELLAKGSRKAAEELGRDSDAFLVDIKGMEPGMHDPRGGWSIGVGYAMSVRGGCHCATAAWEHEWGRFERPEIGLDKNYKNISAEFKGEAAALTTDMATLMNSLCWCKLSGLDIPLDRFVEILNAVADYAYSLEDLMKSAERIFLLQRALGHVWGATAADDCLRPRSLMPLPDCFMAPNSVPDMDTMMADFLARKGLRSEDHKPTPETLEAHGLGYLADVLGV